MKKIILSLIIIIALLLCGTVIIANNSTPHTITFMIDNTTFDTIETRGYEELSLPSVPLKIYYRFDGWFFDKDVWQNKLSFSSYRSKKLSEDVTVYAKFLQTGGLASFYVNGEIYSVFNFLEQTNFTLPEAPNIDGYTFSGWYFDQNVWSEPATAENIESSAKYTSINIYAKFDFIKTERTITFYLDENTTYHTQAISEDQEFTFPTNPTLELHTFDGWFFDYGIWSEEATEDAINSKNDKELKVYAKFSTEYSSDVEYVLSDDESYYIVNSIGNCTASKIFIPNYYNNLPVKEIAYGAFYQNGTIEEILISSNIEKINKSAFRGCSLLTKVSFTENSKVSYLGDFCFSSCAKLEYIFIPKNITAIPFLCFSNCSNLTVEYENPANIISIGESAFISSGITSVPIFANLEYLGPACFSTCKKLTSFYIPKSLKTIDHGAFNECRALKYVEMQDLVSWLNVDITDGRFCMPWIYSNCFYINNEKVLDLVIPEGVTEIKDYAFLDCELLESVTIPESVESIGTGAFADVLKLKTLNYNAKNSTLSIETSSTDLNYPFENAGKYTLTAQAPGWKPPAGYKDIVVNFGENVESIPSLLFYSPSGYYPTFIGTINFASTTPPTIGKNWLTKTSILKAINVPNSALADYTAILDESLHSYIVGV